MASGPIRVQDGPVPWRLCPPHSLSKSLGPDTFLIALVIWLLCHELCLMTTTLQWGLNYTEERRADRLFGWLSDHQAIRNVSQSCRFFAVGVNIFSKLSVDVCV